MKKNTKTPAIFLDRDGTLNIDVGYPDSIEKIELIPGAIEAVKIFNRLGFKVIVVTNQSGVGRGYFNEIQVSEIHKAMKKMFADKEAFLDDFYYCPYHPDAALPEYRKQSEYRKPAPGMLLQAAKDHKIQLENSVMIGDKYSDIAAGKRLDLITILVLTGEGEKQLRQTKNDTALSKPDFIAQDIFEAAQIILNGFQQDGVSDIC